MVKKITIYKIIQLFTNDYRRKLYLREISRLLGKPHQSLKIYLNELESKKILIKNKRKNISEYFLNLKNKLIKDYIVISEKEKTIEVIEKNILLKSLYEKLWSYFPENTFVIFGSSVNKINKKSDIDLLVIGRSKVNRVLNEFEEIYNKKIHKVQITSLNKLSPAFTKELFSKHIILNNTEEVINFFYKKNEENILV